MTDVANDMLEITEETHHIPDDLSLPENLPPSQDILRELAQAVPSRNEIAILDSSLKHLSRNAEEFIKFVLAEEASNISDVSKVLQGYAQAMDKILRQKFTYVAWRQSVAATKTHFHQGMQNEDEFGLSSLAHYHETSDDRMTFSKHLDAQIQHDKTTAKVNQALYVESDPTYQQVSRAMFVLQHPEEPLPETTEADQDDLAVSGGKVSLVDPITLNQLADPVMSRRCKHSYEKSAVEQHLANGSKDCPVDGCESRLAKVDLVPDEIMSLRLMAYRVASTTADDDIDRL